MMERRLGNHQHNNTLNGEFCNGRSYAHYQSNNNSVVDRNGVVRSSAAKVSPYIMMSTDDATTSFPPSSPSSSSSAAAGVSNSMVNRVNGVGFIEHPVSRMDTLAGVAIKYGVEVADIKKMNGLVTDLQMFALKSLRIPLPGRHPPSPFLSTNGSDALGSYEQTPPHHVISDLFDSFQSLRPKYSQRKVSPAMSSLQGYYGLKQTESRIASEGLEMAVYQKEGSHYLQDCQHLKPSPASHPPLSRHRKSRSLVNGLVDEIEGGMSDNMLLAEARESETEKWNEKLVRRRQKSETDFTSTFQDTMMREDNNGGGGFSAITGKGLALRQKAASRAALPSDATTGACGLSPVPTAVGDSFVVNGFLTGVRKSSSASSLQEQEGGSSSMWPTSKWNLKPDLEALSAAAITRPFFDGLPKPTTSRKNKAALD